MAETLLPCPFCGGEPDVHYFAHDDSECTVMCSNPNCRASVSARSCGSMTTAYNRAISLWNRRAERTCGIVRDKEVGCWRCSECGWELTPDEEQFCPMCGAHVIGTVSREEA